MSDGLSLLTAILETGSVQKIREIASEQFTDEELPVFQFITRHLRRYSTLPAIATVESELGISLPEVEEVADYYQRRVIDRQLYGNLRDHFDDLRESLRSMNMDQAREAVSAMHRASRTITHAGQVVDFGSAARSMVEAYDMAHRSPGLTGIPTGWNGLDEITGGYQPGDLVSWVARLGVGKTNALLKQADHAWSEGYSVLVVTTEMPVLQMARRLVGVRTGIDPDLIRKGMLSVWTRRRLGRMVDNLVASDRLNFYSAGMNTQTTDIEALMAELSPDIAYVDGAYLLKTGNKYARSKQERVPEVFDDLRSIALQSNRPLVTSTQFSRQSGKRGKEGSIESIAFTDAIAQNSSLVFALKEGKPPHQATRRVIEVMKGREGEAGEITINYVFSPVDLSEMDEEVVQMETANLDWMGE